MNDRTPGIPDLGRLAGPKPRLGVSVTAFARHLDDKGMFEGVLTRMPNGQMAARAPRESYIDVDELLDLSGERVRIEVAKMLVDAGVIKADVVREIFLAEHPVLDDRLDVHGNPRRPV